MQAEIEVPISTGNERLKLILSGSLIYYADDGSDDFHIIIEGTTYYVNRMDLHRAVKVFTR